MVETKYNIKVRADGQSDIKRIAVANASDTVKLIIDKATVTAQSGRKTTKNERDYLRYFVKQHLKQSTDDEYQDGVYYYTIDVGNRKRFFDAISDDDAEKYLLHAESLVGHATLQSEELVQVT